MRLAATLTTLSISYNLLRQLGVVSAYNNGAPNSRLPPLGWSSWVALGEGWGSETQQPQPARVDFCDEASVRASIDAYHEVGLFAAGYRHFRLDDCWADKHRSASGQLQADRKRFPNGIKPLVDYAHSKNLTFGLYTCAGSHTCVGGRPGSKGHFHEDAQIFAEWGIDSVKMDWCYTTGMAPQETYEVMSKELNATGRPMHFNICEWGYDRPWLWGPGVAQSWRVTGDHHGTWASTRQILQLRRLRVSPASSGLPYAWNDLDLLQTGNYGQAGRPDYKVGTMTAVEYRTEFSMWAILGSPLIVSTPILNCSSTDQIKGNFTPTKCRASITPLQREILLNTEVLAISQDSSPGGSCVWPLDSQSSMPTYVAKSKKSRNLKRSTGCRSTVRFGNDPCTRGISFNCSEGHMWVSAGCEGLFDCNDVEDVLCPAPPKDSNALLISKEGNISCQCVSSDHFGIQVYSRRLSNGDTAVALYNPEDVYLNISFDFHLVGIEGSVGKKVRARDLWAHKNLGEYTEKFPTTRVEPHGALLLRLTTVQEEVVT